MVRILLLGPNRWAKDTEDPEAGLKLRRRIVAEHADLDATWIIMEDDSTPGDPTDKFLALATDPATTHVFLLWPRDARMVGTQDELILWQSTSTPRPRRTVPIHRLRLPLLPRLRRQTRHGRLPPA